MSLAVTIDVYMPAYHGPAGFAASVARTGKGYDNARLSYLWRGLALHSHLKAFADDESTEDDKHEEIGNQRRLALEI